MIKFKVKYSRKVKKKSILIREKYKNYFSHGRNVTVSSDTAYGKSGPFMMDMSLRKSYVFSFGRGNLLSM